MSFKSIDWIGLTSTIVNSSPYDGIFLFVLLHRYALKRSNLRANLLIDLLTCLPREIDFSHYRFDSINKDICMCLLGWFSVISLCFNYIDNGTWLGQWVWSIIVRQTRGQCVQRHHGHDDICYRFILVATIVTIYIVPVNYIVKQPGAWLSNYFCSPNT